MVNRGVPAIFHYKPKVRRPSYRECIRLHLNGYHVEEIADITSSTGDVVQEVLNKGSKSKLSSLLFFWKKY